MDFNIVTEYFRIFPSEKKKRKTADRSLPFLEVTPGFEPGNQGFADPCLTTWLCHHLHCIICELSEKVHPFLKKTQKIFPPSGTPPQTKQCGAKTGPPGTRRSIRKRCAAVPVGKRRNSHHRSVSALRRKLRYDGNS